MTAITTAQLKRTQNDWNKIAGEELTIECDHIENPIYAFGSELGCLRLHYKCKVGRVGYSENLKTWYYVNQ